MWPRYITVIQVYKQYAWKPELTKRKQWSDCILYAHISLFQQGTSKKTKCPSHYVVVLQGGNMDWQQTDINDFVHLLHHKAGNELYHSL
jgi:hypothetical protein